jgi:putative heme transporter
MTDHPPLNSPPVGSWPRVPPALRAAGLVSGCVLLIAGALYVLGHIVTWLSSMVMAVAAALLLAALLEPVVVGLKRLRVPPALGSLVAVVLLVGVFAAPGVLLWNLTAGQFGDIAGRLRQAVEHLRGAATEYLPLDDQQVGVLMSDVDARVHRLLLDAAAGAFTAVEVLAATLLALFLTFFLLKDGPAMWAWTLAQLPARSRPATAEAGAAAWDVLTRYVRGTLIVAAIDAIGIGVALAIIGVPLALPLALLVFVGGLVPYIGATVSGSVAVLVALAANGTVDALLALAAVIVVQQVEGNLLEPFIVGHQVRLHPVVVVLVVFAGTLLYGIVGAVLAVPVTAVAYRVQLVLRARRHPSDVGPASRSNHLCPPHPGEVADDGTAGHEPRSQQPAEPSGGRRESVTRTDGHA